MHRHYYYSRKRVPVPHPGFGFAEPAFGSGVCGDGRTRPQVEKEATGIGGVIANKGGIVVKFVCRGVPLAFVNTHLAARLLSWRR